jgi:hypothetical protein
MITATFYTQVEENSRGLTGDGSEEGMKLQHATLGKHTVGRPPCRSYSVIGSLLATPGFVLGPPPVPTCLLDFASELRGEYRTSRGLSTFQATVQCGRKCNL